MRQVQEVQGQQQGVACLADKIANMPSKILNKKMLNKLISTFYLSAEVEISNQQSQKYFEFPIIFPLMQFLRNSLCLYIILDLFSLNLRISPHITFHIKIF